MQKEFPTEFNFQYLQYSEILLLYLVGRLPTPQDAEDISQEVWMAVLSRKDKVNKPLSRIFTIARNKVADFYRSRNFESHLEITDQYPDGSTRPEDEVVMRQLGEQIVVTFSQMLPIQRVILEMTCDEGMSYEEISSRTGNSLSSVKSRINKARKSFQRNFNDRDS